MTAKEPRRTTRWALFPLKGFDLTNKTADIRKPMFGDGTIVSLTHVPTLLARLTKGMKQDRAQDLAQTTKSILEYVNSVEEFQSFVAVRRTARQNATKHNRGLLSEEPWFRSARKRAREITSGVSLVLLAMNQRGATCGLVEDFGKSSQHFLVLDFETSGFAFQAGGTWGHMAYARERAIRLTRRQLRARINCRACTALTQVLLYRKAKLSKWLRTILVEASLNLGIAVHATMPEGRLLGAVTAIEILLSDDFGRFETTKRRLQVIVGQRATQAFKADEVLKSRHAYVHRGQAIADPELPLFAVKLALTCLFRVAETAVRFRSRSEMLDYLEFAAGSSRVFWTNDEKDALKKIIRHPTDPISLPFLKL